MHLTRLSRLFFVFLISAVLPFANVAATALPHCTQSTKVFQPATVAVITSDSAHHAHHDRVQAAQDIADDHCDQQQHHSSGNSQTGCNHCAYCQSGTFAMALPLAGQVLPDEPVAIEKFRIADPVPQPFHEQPFHPPRYAFA